MRKRKYALNEHVFDVIDTPAKAYWLGYLYCAGCVRYDSRGYGVLTLESIDFEHLDKWAGFLQTSRPIYKTNNSTRQVQIYSDKLVQKLMSYGVVPRKTYDHSVPVYIPPGDLERHFWRGCIDADGSVNYSFKPWKSGRNQMLVNLPLNNTNLELLQGLQKYFGGGHISEHKCGAAKQRTVPNFIYLPSCQTLPGVLKYLDLLYKDVPEQIRLERKYQKYVEIKNYYLTKGKEHVSTV